MQETGCLVAWCELGPTQKTNHVVHYVVRGVTFSTLQRHGVCKSVDDLCGYRGRWSVICVVCLILGIKELRDGERREFPWHDEWCLLYVRPDAYDV
jgi:hypothetical protein